jgi:hypothetical protein
LAIDQGGVVAQAETARSGERRVKPPDALELVQRFPSHGS